jgi:hypothetical protein
MSDQSPDQRAEPLDSSVDNAVDDDDQDSEPTMKAPDDRRPDGTVADLHSGSEGEDEAGGSGTGAG